MCLESGVTGVSVHTWKTDGSNEASGGVWGEEEGAELRGRHRSKHGGIEAKVLLVGVDFSRESEWVGLPHGPTEGLAGRAHLAGPKCEGLPTSGRGWNCSWGDWRGGGRETG